MPKTKEQRYEEAVERALNNARFNWRSKHPEAWPGSTAARGQFGIRPHDDRFDDRLKKFFTFPNDGGSILS